MSTESTSLTGINSATKTSAAINYKNNKNKHNHNNNNNKNNNNNNNNSPSTVAMNSSTTAATPAAVIKIKKELPNEEIKEFAENTMNELLGWYGFDGVDRLDLSAKTTRLLQVNSTSTSTTIATITNVTTTESLSSCSGQSNRNYNQKNCINNNGNKVICINTTPQQYEKRRSRSLRTASTLQQQQENEYMRSFNKELQQYRNPHNNNNNNKNNNNTNQKNNINNNSNNNSRKSLLNCHNYHQRPGEGNDSTTSDHDTHSSRDDDSISPNSMGTNNNKTPTIITMRNSANSMEEKIDLQNCCWCHRPVPDNAPDYLTTTDCPRYCSESCFTQSRRASFKKAKTCDWCKHIRHAVSYVDFQDGASQLQFCSDKCLNQYKMQIFCKETQAHLDMNPHLREQGLEAVNSGVGLITPDLWLKNCRSRSASPTSTVSLPPSPKAVAGQSKLSSPTRSIGSSVLSSSCGIPGTVKASIYKPLISVAPVAKLMSNKSPTLIAAASTVRQATPSKHNRKKRPVRTTCAATMSDVNSMKTNCSPCASSNSPINANVLLTKSHLRASSRDNNRLHANQSHTTPSLTQFAGSSVQDLHMNVPPLSPMMEPSVNSGTTTHGMPSFGPGLHGANYFNSSPVSVLTGTPGFPSRPPPPPSFLPNPAGLLPRFLHNFPTLPPAPIPPPLLMTPEMSAFNALIGTPPPVTVMVPYPVVIPLPIPIPIPLPVLDFYKAHLTPEDRQKFDHQRSTVHEEYKLQSPNQTNEKRMEKEERRSSNTVEQPLDCSKTREVETLKEEYDSTIDAAIDQTVEYSPKKSENIAKTFNSEMDKNLHCVPEKDEVSNKEINKDNNNVEESFEVEASGSGRGEETEDGEVIQKLPKLKITRLQNKRPQIHTKESECSRPLRKRKRIIDCDFQKIHLKESYGENEDQEEDLTQQLAAEATSDTNKAGNSKK